jgi:hypothetical protein
MLASERLDRPHMGFVTVCKGLKVVKKNSRNLHGVRFNQLDDPLDLCGTCTPIPA